MPLFTNAQIDRGLSLSDLRIVLDYIAQQGHGQWDRHKQQFIVYYKTPAEWAKEIYNWAEAAGKINNVVTVFNLREGEETDTESFHLLPHETILAALKILEGQDRCRMIKASSGDGVKFLYPK